MLENQLYKLFAVDKSQFCAVALQLYSAARE